MPITSLKNIYQANLIKGLFVLHCLIINLKLKIGSTDSKQFVLGFRIPPGRKFSNKILIKLIFGFFSE